MRESKESHNARMKALAYLRAGGIATAMRDLCAKVPAAADVEVDIRYMQNRAAVVLWKPTGKGKRFFLSILFHCDGTFTMRRVNGACRDKFASNSFPSCEKRSEEAVLALGVP